VGLAAHGGAHGPPTARAVQLGFDEGGESDRRRRVEPPRLDISDDSASSAALADVGGVRHSPAEQHGRGSVASRAGPKPNHPIRQRQQIQGSVDAVAAPVDTLDDASVQGAATAAGRWEGKGETTTTRALERLEAAAAWQVLAGALPEPELRRLRALTATVRVMPQETFEIYQELASEVCAPTLNLTP